MQVFRVDKSPSISATMLADHHVGKLLMEACQLMCTAHHLDGGQKADLDALWRPTHANHPCAIWVREASNGYQWVYEHAEALAHEFNFRYNKPHAAALLLPALRVEPTSAVTTSLGPQAFPEWLKDPDYVKGYRAYYLTKPNLRWKNKRPAPLWYKWGVSQPFYSIRANCNFNFNREVSKHDLTIYLPSTMYALSHSEATEFITLRSEQNVIDIQRDYLNSTFLHTSYENGAYSREIFA